MSFIKASIHFLLFLPALNLFSQKIFYGEEPVRWENYDKALPIIDGDKYSTSDLVILRDVSEFVFYSSNNEKIKRNITFKINNEKGLEALRSYKLPESFDAGYDANYFKQGRIARIKTPFIKEYSISKFMARKFRRSRWSDVSFQLKYESVQWMRSAGDFAGEFMNENLTVFQLQDLEVGDIVQVVYEAAFDSNYGDNLFYFNTTYPKLHCQYTFNYKVNRQYLGYAFIFPINVSDTMVKRESNFSNNYSIIKDRIDLYNLDGINYPSNSFGGNTLPHVFADFNVYRKLSGSYPNEDGTRVRDYVFYRPRNFEWVILTDTTNNYTKIYDKQFAAIRKFLGKIPPYEGKDSTNNIFFKALCDTFNNFRYISANQMFYNESNLRDVYSGDHLSKRRLMEHLQWKLYKDILNDAKVFYSVANVQDKRFGEHNPNYRASYAYETQLIAIPSKDSYIYFMPRYNGMKYHLNELPFYFEGTLALLSPKNFQASVQNKDQHFFKFIKTHRATFNENTRTENVSVRVVLDSLKADLSIKESLSGQFSTVLRHLYLNETIDSTISPHYFKRCTEKPFAFNAKIKLSSKITEFPFRYNFNCTERISLPGDKHLRLKSWFSFIPSKASLPEIPNHDYYFDFDFSDSYNFLLNFDHAVELKNASSFLKKINNAYFELESEIITNSETSYLLKVKVLAKQIRIPKEKLNILMDLVKELDELNDFSLELLRK